MIVKTKYEKDIKQRYIVVLRVCIELVTNCAPPSFVDLSKVITDNGGKIVDLDESKLTHIIIDKRDDSRRLELMKRTSK
jgi:DNA ligase-4